MVTLILFVLIFGVVVLNHAEHFLHSLRIEDNSRRFLANEDLSDFYLNRFFEGDSTLDKIHHTRISNLLGVELHEGFNKWAA